MSNNEKAERIINELEKSIAGHAAPMAVVDYIGKSDCDGLIDESSDLDRRYGTRGLNHVEIYNLTVVRLNPAASKLGV